MPLLVLTACGGGAQSPAGGGGQPTSAAAPAATTATRPAAPPGATASPGAGAASSPSAAAEPVTVTFGYVTDNLNHWPVYIAQEQGFFTREGITLDLVQTRSSVSSVQFTTSGSVNVATATADAIISGIAQGGNARIVGGFNRAAYALVAKPEIATYEALRGKVVGVSALRAGETPLIRALFRARGLGDDDYQFIVAGGTPERITALRSGTIDATMLTPPLDLPLVKDGFTNLGSSLEVLPDFAFLVLMANTQWASANRDAMTRVLRSLVAATDWLLAPPNRDQAVRILADRLKTTPEEAAQTYDATVASNPPLFYPKMQISESSLKSTLDSLVEAAVLNQSQVDATRYLDSTYLEQATR